MKCAVLALVALWTVSSAGAAPLSSGIQREYMDPSVRPQDDLYLAINGEWLKTVEIPADRSNYGAFGVLEDVARDRTEKLLKELASNPQEPRSELQKLRDMYLSYMDEEGVERRGLEPLRADIAAVDGLRTHEEVARAFATFSKVGVSTPLSFSVRVDAKNSAQHLASINQSGLTLPDRDYYLGNEPRYLEARAAYVAYVKKLLTEAGEQAARINDAAENILALETALAKAHWTRLDLRDPEKNYNKVLFSELATLAPGFPWPGYFSELGVTVEQVNVSQPSYATELGTLLTSTPVEVWRDFLKFKLLDAFAHALPKRFQDAHFELHGKALAGVPVQKSRSHRAIDVISGARAGEFGVLGDAVGRRYVEMYFPPEAKKRMDALVANLLAAYRTSINEITWMGPETKQRALDKLSKYRVKIGYTENWRDYSNLEIRPDDLIGNLKAGAQHSFSFQRSKLGKPVDPREWSMTPQTVNAYYSPSRNEIVFPAAILQPPYFNVEADDAVNYGAIGAVIGHEISHGFDDKGSKYDGDGNLRNWWTPEDRRKFEELTAKLVAQYSAYEPLPGRKLNGQLTLGENIADVSGLSIAYKAYRLSLGGKEAPVIDGFTGDQRFFLGWAQSWKRKYREAEMAKRLLTDVHSPSHFRGNGAPINIDAFHEAFATKPGDGMYKAPEDRIRIW
jgi:putative endopeptidase